MKRLRSRTGQPIAHARAARFFFTERLQFRSRAAQFLAWAAGSSCLDGWVSCLGGWVFLPEGPGVAARARTVPAVSPFVRVLQGEGHPSEHEYTLQSCWRVLSFGRGSRGGPGHPLLPVGGHPVPPVAAAPPSSPFASQPLRFPPSIRASLSGLPQHARELTSPAFGTR